MMGAPRCVLITGAAGFVGRNLLPALAATLPGADLVAADFDLLDKDAIEAGVRAAAPDAVIHLAAISAITAAREEPDHAWRVNLDGTRHLARAILTHAPETQLLFVSTAEAYGASFLSGAPLDESAPLAPLNVYGATKAAADLALGAMAADGLRVVRLRAFNHTGPAQTEQFVVAAFARQLARVAAGLQPPALKVGNLESWRDFLDVRDVCAAYAACLVHGDRLAPGTILNIASGVPRRIGDVLDQLIALAGVTVRIDSTPSRRRAVEIRHAAGNARRAQDLLEWRPVVPWAETLANVMAYWHDQVRRQEAPG